MFYPGRHRPLLGRQGAFTHMNLVFQHKSGRMLASLTT